MNDRSIGVAGTAALASLVIVCCAGPLLLAAAASLGPGAWLVAHGLWLLGGAGLLVAGASLIAALRRRRVAVCAAGERGADAASATRRPEPRHLGRS
jgi:hypothetical protein